MTRIDPYLHFDGTCREAMTFYQAALGGELKLMTVGESPMAGKMPAAMHKNILHATLVSEGFTLMASDMMGPGGIKRGNALSLSLASGNRKEIESAFAKLSAGGNVTHKLQDEFFGLHGALTDRFGVDWMFTFEDQTKRPS
jgi:PhnB protein